MTNNEIWRSGTGFIAAYTEDKDLMRSIERYKTDNDWTIIAEYIDTKARGKLVGVQYRIPVEQRRQAMRMFTVVKMKD